MLGETPQRQAMLAKNRQNYLRGRGADMAQRRAGVRQNAMARDDARRMRMGNLSMGEQAMFGIPGYAEARLQHQGSMAWLQGQQQMFQQKQMADMHNGYMERMAQLAGAIPGMNLPPGLQQQYMNHIMGQVGMPPVPAGAYARSPLDAPKAEDLAKVSPAERQQLIREFSPETQARLLSDAHGISDSPGFMEWLMSLANLVPAPGMATAGMRTGSYYAPGAKEELKAARGTSRPSRATAAPRRSPAPSPYRYIPFLF